MTNPRVRRVLFASALFALLLAGLEIARSLLFPHATSEQSLTLRVAFATLALTIALYVDMRRHMPPPPDVERQQLEARLNELNQELEVQAREQTSQVARLNVELALEMAMHKRAEEAALASEARFRSMADHVHEGLTILENDQIVYANQQVCDIFGEYPEGDLRRRLQRFVLPEAWPHVAELLAECATIGECPHQLEFWIQRSDGQRRCLSELYSSTETGGVPRTFIVTSDITERAEAYHTLEQAVADRTRELSILLDISARLASTLQLEPLLNLILDHIRDLLPYSGAAIFTLKDDVLHVLAYQLPGLPSLPTPLRLPLDQAGPYLTVIEQRQVLVLDDVACDPPLARAIRSTTGRDAHSDFTHAHSWVGIPLVVRDKAEGLLSLTHAQPGFYTARHAQLAQAVAHHAASAIDNARLYEQAQALAAVEERQRLARELHDSATQLLYGITLMAGASSKALNSGNLATLKDSLGEIKQHALQALQEMRLLILELDPPLLQEAGLTAALKTSLSSIETRTGLHTDFEARDLERLPASVEMALYRIAMEALNNLVRYARAQDAQVRLWREDGCVHLEICDNGIGFDLEAVRRSSGMGLHSMEQRARQIGGRLDIVTAPGQGARILVTAPLQTELLFEPVLTQEIPTPNKTNDTNDFS